MPPYVTGSILQADYNQEYYTDTQTGDIVFRSMSNNVNWVFGGFGSNMTSTIKISNSNTTINSSNIIIAGSVGIGSSNPIPSSTSLQVIGTTTTTVLSTTGIIAQSNTLNIGTDSGSTLVNVGNAGAVLNLTSSNLTVTNKKLTLNTGGASGTGFGAGFDIEEGGVVTGYVKTAADGNGFVIKAPNGTSNMVINMLSNTVNINNNSLVIASNSYVGVGTATPQYLLDIAGSVNTNNSVYAASNVAIGTTSASEKLTVATGNIALLHAGSYGGSAQGDKWISIGDKNATMSPLYQTSNYGVSAGWSNDVCFLGFRDMGATKDAVISTTNNLRFQGPSNLDLAILTKNGQFGIGQSNPQYPLDVVGQASVTGTMYLKNTTSTVAQSATPSHGLTDTSSPGSSNSLLLQNSNGTMIMMTGLSNDLVSGGQIALTITQTGSVGICASNPQAKFHVISGQLASNNGSVITHASFQVADTNVTQLRVKSVRTSNGASHETDQTRIQRYVDAAEMGYIAFDTQGTSLGNNVTEGIRLTPTGWVGIGTSNPGQNLDVVGTTQTIALLASNLTVTHATISNASASNMSTNTFSASNMICPSVIAQALSSSNITVASSATMNVVYASNMGVNTTTPNASYNVDVAGKLNACNIFLNDQALNVNYWLSNSTAPATYTMSNVGIGTSNPSSALHVSGDVTIDSNVIMSKKISLGGLNIKPNLGGMANVSVVVTSIPGYSYNSSNVMFNAYSNLPMLFQVGGSEVLRLDGTGNIGIGTSSPEAKMDVVGNTRLTASNVLASTAKLMVTGTEGTLSDSTVWVSSGSTWATQTTFANTSSNGRQYQLLSTGGSNTNAVGAFMVYDATASVPRITVTSNGNVGVGTSTPSNTMDINGSLRVMSTNTPGGGFYGSVQVTNPGGYGGLLIDHQSTYGNVPFRTASSDPLVVQAGSNNTWLKISKGTGYVGVANSNPAYTLDVTGTVNASNFLVNGSSLTTLYAPSNSQVTGTYGSNTASWTSNNHLPLAGGTLTGSLTSTSLISTSNIRFGAIGGDYYMRTSGQGHIWANDMGSNTFSHLVYSVGSNGSAGDHVFYTGGDSAIGAGVERMRISSTGKVGFGTSSPSTTMHILSNVAGGSTELTVQNSAVATGHFWRLGHESGDGFHVFNQSNVGMYITNGATTWTATSDERVKKSIEIIPGCLDKIGHIRPVKYHYDHDHDQAQKRVGVIAQDVEKVLPEAVVHRESHGFDDLKGVNYTELIPLLIGAIQELSETVRDLEVRHKFMSEEVANLKYEMTKSLATT